MAEHPVVLGKEAPALLEVMRLGALLGDASQLVDLLCEQAGRLTGADYAGIRLVDELGNAEWRGMWGNRTDAWVHRRASTQRGTASEAMQSARTIISRGADLLARRARMHAYSVRANEGGLVELATPLAFGSRSFGALVLGWRTEVEVTEEQQRVAEALASYGTLLLESARARQESERRRAEAEALAELARQGAADQQMELVVELVCKSACRIVGAEFAALMLRLADGGVSWMGVAGNRAEIWYERHNPSGRGPAATSMAERRTVVFRRGAEGADGELQGLAVLAAEDTQTALAVPLLRRDGAFGSLVLGWRQPEPVTPEQRRLAEALSGYAGAVLDNALAHAALQERAETVRLANEQLTHLDEMKSNLISNVSHELRTPLTSIRAFSELLLDSNVDNDTRLEFAHIINVESERLTRLVSNLLDLSRIQSRGVTWDFQELELPKQLERAVSALRPSAEEKHLRLRLELPEPLPRAVADPDGLQQAMLNLISNAIKFTLFGEVIVSAAIEGSQVRITVTDTGPGIAPDEQSHIFDRFYQSGDILTSKPAGSGLGLAITKEILIQHGTDICLASSAKGSEFSFLLQQAPPVAAM